MQRILLSALVVGGVVGAAVYGTTAFFSDTETSVDNTFQAGSIDLKVGNSSYLVRDGEISQVESSTWEVADLVAQKFFSFEDIKPEDMSEDTITLEVTSNPAWVCANIEATSASESGVLDPEVEAGDDVDDGNWDGELDNELNFVFWADDGDNVHEVGEEVLMAGPASNLPQGDNNGGATYPVVDSTTNPWGVDGDPMQPGPAGQVHIGKAWCYGAIAPAPVSEADTNPIDRGTTGISCDGSAVGNISQSDALMGDITFTAVQSRNNAAYVCGQVNQFEKNVICLPRQAGGIDSEQISHS